MSHMLSFRGNIKSPLSASASVLQATNRGCFIWYTSEDLQSTVKACWTAILWKTNSQSSSRFLFLRSSCVRFKSGGRSVGDGRTVCGLCVYVWDGLKSREEDIFFAPFRFCSSLALEAQQNELNLFIPWSIPQMIENDDKYAREL